MQDEDTTQEPRGIPRRTVVKGAAWSVPVIALAVTAPAASASTCTTSVGILDMTLYAVATHNGAPMYSANNEPYVDLTIGNVGTCDLAAGSFYVQISQNSNLIPNYTGVAPGWTLLGTGTTSGGIAYIRLANSSPLLAGATVKLHQILHVTGNPPAGYTQGNVNATVVATGNQNQQISGNRPFYTTG